VNHSQTRTTAPYTLTDSYTHEVLWQAQCYAATQARRMAPMFDNLTDAELDTLAATLDSGADKAYKMGDFLNKEFNSPLTATGWIHMGNEVREMATMAVACRHTSW
jgi:hypothetical protein